MSFACKEEFLLNVGNDQNHIVVDGFITNEPGPYSIKISRSTNVVKPVKIPFSNCEVTIYDYNGYSEVLIETEPGTYKTKEDGIKGTIGNKYRITIATSNNKKYETEFQEMLEPVGIDSLYVNLEYIELMDDQIDLPGYQFYVSTENTQKNSSYLLWHLTETYEYIADFTLYAMYTQNGMIYCNTDAGCPDLSPYYTCWKTEPVKNIFTAETASLNIPIIENKKLHFVGTNSRRLKVLYSVLVTQYTIENKAYMFWKTFEDQISEDNFLFPTQPINVASNITNINNPDETIFGYFTVASLNKKRIFVENPREVINYEKCYVMHDWTSLTRPLPWYFIITNDGMGLVENHCFDCRSFGGILEKPDFWIDYK